MIYMFCYDITDPKRLRRTAKLLEDHGIRIQYSFFQCEISKEGMEKLKDKILSVIDVKSDRLFIYPLCEDCGRKVKTDGVGSVIQIKAFEIL